MPDLTPTLTPDARARVAKGVARLNAYFGHEQWMSDITREDLELARCEQCILGQLFGDYAAGLEALYGIECAYLPSHDFEAREDGFERKYGESWAVYAALEAAWLEALDG